MVIVWTGLILPTFLLANLVHFQLGFLTPSVGLVVLKFLFLFGCFRFQSELIVARLVQVRNFCLI